MLETVHIALTAADMVLTVVVLVKARHTRHVERKLDIRHDERQARRNEEIRRKTVV